MANQQLVDYIKSQLAAGVTKPDLQKAITTAGWSEQDSTDAFNVVEGKVPATPAPAVPKPAAPVQPASQPQQPTQQSVKPAQVQQPMQPTTPTQQPIINPAGPTSAVTPNLGGPMRASTMQMNVERGGPRNHTLLWATLAVAVLLVAGSAAAYMYVPAVQEVVNFYLSGGQVQTPVDILPVDDTVVPDTTATTTMSTATTTQEAGANTVASSTASTTLGQ